MMQRPALRCYVAQPMIDPHHHLWDLGRNKYPWLQEHLLTPRLEGDVRPIAKDYLLEDYLADARNQNVVKSRARRDRLGSF